MAPPTPRFLNAVQAHVARASLGASTVRGRGNKDAGKSGRKVLAPLNLRQFATRDPVKFSRALDKVTERVRRSRRPALTWGLARKCVNIFLREALYNRYLCRHHGLQRGEKLFEIPMDSLVAKELRRQFGEAVPRWPGVAGLTPDANALYQQAAAVAAKQGKLTARVHLDAFVWGRPQETEKPRRRVAAG